MEEDREWGDWSCLIDRRKRGDEEDRRAKNSTRREREDEDAPCELFTSRRNSREGTRRARETMRA